VIKWTDDDEVKANQVELNYDHQVLSDGIFVNSLETYFKDPSGTEKIYKRTPQEIYFLGAD